MEFNNRIQSFQARLEVKEFDRLYQITESELKKYPGIRLSEDMVITVLANFVNSEIEILLSRDMIDTEYSQVLSGLEDGVKKFVGDLYR